MARPARGHEFVDAATTQAAQAKTILELRMAQALLLPLQFGLSLDDTSVAVGRSKSWTLRLRTRFGRIQRGQEQPKTKKGLRNRARMTLDEEAAILAPYLEQAKVGGVIVVPPLKAKLETAVGRPLAVSTVYAMLHRHGWRKLAPDKQHPQSDPAAQEAWKKLPEAITQACEAFDRPAPLRLMFQDEARFGRISHTRYCWCPKPVRPLTHAMATQEYTYAYAAVSPGDGILDTLILPSVNGECMQIFVDETGARHREEHVLMVVDGAGWHRNQALRLPRNLQLLFLPPYAPELNPVEHLWDDLLEKSFHNRVFDSIESLEAHLEQALADFEKSPNRTEELQGGPDH